MSSAASKRRSRLTLAPAEARDELNLAEFPITFLGDRVPEGQDTLEYKDTVRDPRTGELVTRKLTITASTKYGLPTAKDDEIILGLMHLTKLANKYTKRQVSFSRYELIHLLGWPDTGQSYARVEESLNRWMTVTLFYDKAWWDNARQSWVDEKFHVLEHVSLYEHERKAGRHQGQQHLPFSTFTWSKTLFKSFNAGYLKRLDLDFFLDLTYPTAKRIYRFLDKRFYHGPHWEFDLQEFAFEHVGLSRSYKKAAEVRRKLAPAIEELENKDFLEPMPPKERFQQIIRGQWRVSFQKKACSAEDIAEKPEKSTPAPCEKALIDRGVTPSTAAQLTAAYSAEAITQKLEVFDWLVQNKDQRLSKNPAGYLVDSIRKDYAAPAGFEPRAVREQKKQTAEQRQKQKQEEAAAARRQLEQEQATLKAVREHINRILKSLTPQELKALEDQALANADEKSREVAQGQDKIAKAMRRNLLEREILRVYALPPEPQPTA
jgi:hypothetical protein